MRKGVDILKYLRRKMVRIPAARKEYHILSTVKRRKHGMRYEACPRRSLWYKIKNQDMPVKLDLKTAMIQICNLYHTNHLFISCG